MRNLFNERGSTLISVIIAIGLTGILGSIFMNFSKNAKVTSDSYKKMEMRAELLAILKRIHDDTDCSSNKDDKNGPVELKEDADKNSETVIPINGTRIGRFSVIATKNNDEIKLELAAFKKKVSNVRAKINSPSDSDFAKTGESWRKGKKFFIWNKANTMKTIKKNFPKLIDVCHFPNREIKYCPPGKVANAFDYERKKVICKKPLRVDKDPDPDKEEKAATDCGTGGFLQGFDKNGHAICKFLAITGGGEINVDGRYSSKGLGDQHFFCASAGWTGPGSNDSHCNVSKRGNNWVVIAGEVDDDKQITGSTTCRAICFGFKD